MRVIILLLLLINFSCSDIDDSLSKSKIERVSYYVQFLKDGSGVITDRHSCLGVSELRNCEYLSGFHLEKSFIQVWAVPKLGNKFIGWAGDYDTDENPLTIFVNSDKKIIAKFSH